ncbi:hypothetical protein Vadar_029403 [Vaccinium darrowii]|uniref:Uncharacterized protein n=1 Tax=Vaccinium darrowii TaxID=229202 RepID=A0ACB7XL74_9ERIC|nr:hypothetical protein Vadar_029403 [Vaccinium darrowii]
MPSGNAGLSDKMQYPSGGGGAGGAGEILHHPHRQWFPDERDGFISWLRGEFAAANAMIDSLCHHLRLVGDPGEYDWVIGCIQQRRCNWSPVLHMQQYFSVAEVMYALQQVAWRRQNRVSDQGKVVGNRRSGFGYRQGPTRAEFVKGSVNPNAEYQSYDANASGNFGGFERGDRGKRGEAKCGGEEVDLDGNGVALVDVKKDVVEKPEEDCSIKSSGNSQGTSSGHSELEVEELDEGCASDSKGSCNVPVEDDSCPVQTEHEKALAIIPRTFVCTEIFDGKSVNVLDGMKLYEEFIHVSEVSKLVLLVNDLRAAGKKGQFQGQTFVVSKRPMKGHGREMIQFGIPIADAPPEDENAGWTSKDRRIEPIPSLLQDVIERLVGMKVMTAKPDSCIIDVFNEGDHSQPYMWPSWFGRPVSLLVLTECDMIFGKVTSTDNPGDYRGSLRLSLAPGSLLVMQGNSADLARHAIPSLRKPRILVTFTKSLPRKTTLGDGHRLPSASVAPNSHWGPLPSRSPNHIRHPGPKHYGPGPSTGVLPAPNGIQPLFVPAPVSPPMSFPSPVALPPVSSGWPVVPPPRHPPPPRLPVPGTGVFLPPPGSGNSSETSFSGETTVVMEKDNGLGKPNSNSSVSPKGQVDAKMPRKECNGSVDGGSSTDTKAANKPGGTV